MVQDRTEKVGSMRDLRRHYRAGGNVISYFRTIEGGEGNSAAAVLAAYDLQAGSYVRAMADPSHHAVITTYAKAIGCLFERLGATSVIEAGVGEATTLVPVIKQMRRPPEAAAGFDISWSRIFHANRYAAAEGAKLDLFAGDLFAPPVIDQAFDVVFTSHAIEPNRGTERAAVAALYRLARRYLVLLEPASALGNHETQERIERHKYCTGLADHARALGMNVVEHRLFDVQCYADNQTELIVIARSEAAPTPASAQWLGCPCCHAPIAKHLGHHYCADCCLIYPVVGGIACFSPRTAILGSAYIEAGA